LNGLKNSWSKLNDFVARSFQLLCQILLVHQKKSPNIHQIELEALEMISKRAVFQLF